MFNYTKAFAQSIWQPFTHGSPMGLLIENAASTKADLLADDRNHVSETGLRYEADHMDKLWTTVLWQKRHTQALWLVSRGFARSLDAGLRMVGAQL